MVPRLSPLFVVLLVVLVLLILGGLPYWQYSSGWGYYPSGIGMVILLVLLVLLFTGRTG